MSVLPVHFGFVFANELELNENVSKSAIATQKSNFLVLIFKFLSDLNKAPETKPYLVLVF